MVKQHPTFIKLPLLDIRVQFTTYLYQRKTLKLRIKCLFREKHKELDTHRK